LLKIVLKLIIVVGTKTVDSLTIVLVRIEKNVSLETTVVVTVIALKGEISKATTSN